MLEPETQDYVAATIEILTGLTQDWNTGLEGSMGPDTCIVADLGFESLDVVYLVTALEQKFDRRDLPFENLLMTKGRYVEDIRVSQIAEFLQRHL